MLVLGGGLVGVGTVLLDLLGKLELQCLQLSQDGVGVGGSGLGLNLCDQVVELCRHLVGRCEGGHGSVSWQSCRGSCRSRSERITAVQW